MNKEEFLKTLRKRLNILEDKEIEDIISEYKGYIEEKVNIGKTEEEAVKELGNIDEIVSDLLAAYKVKNPTPEENSFTKFINKIMNYLDRFIEELNNKSAKDIIKFIIEICLILIIISLFKIPFNLLSDLGWNIFRSLPNSISSAFYSIWSFIIELSYFILSIVMFIKIFEKRYFEGLTESIITTAETEIRETKEEAKTKKQSQKTSAEELKNEETKIISNPPKEKGFFSTITNICIIFLKIIVIFCLIGVISYLVGISVAIGLMIYLIVNGVKYFGITILLIALLSIGALLLKLGTNFIFNKKTKASHVFGEIITIVILTGIGLTLSAIEIANTEIIYENYYQNTKTITKNLSMNNNLILYNYDNVIIDNTLTNTIKIEYKYPDLNESIDLNIDLDNCGLNCYRLNTDIKNIKWSKALFNDLIENLKNKKIYTYEFYLEKTIYLSETNYNILTKNNERYDYDNNYSSQTFTKTYHVLNIEESNNSEYLYLTLNEYRFDEIETVRVSRSLASNVTSGQNYEFTFEYRGNELDRDDIDEIFDECTLIQIKYTDKLS